MKALTSALALFGLILISIFSCQRDVSGGPDPDNPPEVEYVNANITGRITDDADKPVQGAQVKSSAGTITNTDINGFFRFDNIRVDKNAGFVLVEKDGFFQGSRTVVAGEGTTNYVDIQLIKKTVAGTVSGATGGTVTVANGGSIQLPANGVMNPVTKAAYTGTVSVSAYFLDPEHNDFGTFMPGTLRGITTNNEERALESYGMLAVELNGASNEKLQLANGKTATLTFPIPASLQANAPATIPLWFFSDSSGLWIEQGSATKQGTNYVGTVSHFSFWNCDWPHPVVDFKAVIKDQGGNALYPARVTLEMGGTSMTTEGWTNSAGAVSGKVPTNKTFKLTVYNKCGQELYTGNIGPFTNAADIGTVTVNGNNGTQLTISGTVVNCSMTPVTNGYVDIGLDNMYYRALVTNGTFSTTLTRCSATPATAVVTAIDLANAVTGTPVNVQVTSGTANAGQLAACGNTIPEFIYLKVHGIDYNYLPPADSVIMYRQGSFSVYGSRKSGSRDMVSFTFSATATGTVPMDFGYVRKGDSIFYDNGAVNINITEFGAVGGYVAGNFASTFAESDSTAPATAPVNVSFRVKRTQ